MEAWDKTLTMERHVSYLRAIVIAFNITAYFQFIGLDAPRAPLALTIIIVAGLYGLWSLLARPYERFPLLRFGAATLTMDALLITLWVLATGGVESEFWIIYLVSIVSVAMRYDIGQTLAAAVGEGALYSIAMAIDGGLSPVAAAVRPTYIMIAGLAAGLLARQERIAHQERLVSERLAEERAHLLERERQVVEQLRALDTLKSEFVANAAHELRTPLTTLSGLASTLAAHAERMSGEDMAWALGSMRRQGERTRVLIENLLDLSALERGRMMVALTPVSLPTAVARALESAPPPTDKQIQITVDEIAAIADPARLEQVLTNLLVNAYHYGGSTITISAAGSSVDVVLTISDDGPGLPPEMTAHLFEPFSRGNRAGDTRGSGLGLMISRRLVEAFGGELRYEPGEPRGSSFVITLRRAS